MIRNNKDDDLINLPQGYFVILGSRGTYSSDDKKNKRTRMCGFLFINCLIEERVHQQQHKVSSRCAPRRVSLCECMVHFGCIPYQSKAQNTNTSQVYCCSSVTDLPARKPVLRVIPPATAANACVSARCVPGLTS